MMGRRKLGASLVALCAVAGSLWAATAAAQGEARQRDGRILHRYFDVDEWQTEGDDDRELGPRPSDQGEGEEGLGGATSEPPPSRPDSDAGAGWWLSPGEAEWIWTPDGPVGPGSIDAPHGDVADASRDTPLDGDTAGVDELSYQSNFQPSVVPFKRGTAQQEIRRRGNGQVLAGLERGELRPVEVGGQPQAGEDSFRGSFLMRMEAGEPQPVASVAPQQRVLSLESEPRVDLELRRDAADNLYLVSPVDEVVRINMDIAVDRFYFDGDIDPGVGWEEIDGLATGLEDAGLRQEAEEILGLIGVGRQSQRPDEALAQLVEYHRSFAYEEAPDIEAGDEYRQISTRQVGVCRHRSLTFMVSARSLGFEVRYVFNEAHAFVEVYWPGQGWRRIDLGGAAETFEFGGAGGGGLHDGHHDQGFPRPESYEQEMQAMAGADGEGAEQGADDMSAMEEVLGDDSEGGPMELEEAPGAEAMEAMEAVESSGQIQVTEAYGELFRGREVFIVGQAPGVEDGQKVEVYLSPSGGDGSRRVELGRADVRREAFAEEFRIPPSLGLGRWSLEAEVVDP